MKVYLSGQARLAAVFDGGSLVCLKAGQDHQESRPPGEFEWLFADVGDLRVEYCSSWTEVSSRLDEAVRRDDALALFLIAVDHEADSQARDSAVPLIEKALEQPIIREFLIRRLSSAQLPANADVKGLLARSARAGALAGVLEEIRGLQGAIGHVCSAWNSLGNEEGFNVLSERYENLLAAGVIDATRTVRSALENAVFGALSLLLEQSPLLSKEVQILRPEAQAPGPG